jgi:CheY-like chemotaxis protein
LRVGVEALNQSIGRLKGDIQSLSEGVLALVGASETDLDRSKSISSAPFIFEVRLKMRNSSPVVRILVVDDYAPFRRFVHATLTSRPELQVVGEASDGLQAVQKAEELQPDLILLDIGLPTLNGIEAAHRITGLVPGATILFVSQNNDADVVAAALSNGAKGYVLKLNANGELLPAVEAVLRGEHFVGTGVRQCRATAPLD